MARDDFPTTWNGEPVILTEWWAVHAVVHRTVTERGGTWSTSTHFPTFYLSSRAQGLLTARSAELVARDVILAAGGGKLPEGGELAVTAYPVDGPLGRTDVEVTP